MLAFSLSAPSGWADQVSEALFKKGYQQLMAGAYSAAIENFNRGLQSNPDDALAHFYLGQAKWSLGQKDAAATEFKESLRIDSNSLVANQARTRLNDVFRSGYSGKVFHNSSQYEELVYGDVQPICIQQATRNTEITFSEDGSGGRMVQTSKSVAPG